MTSCDCRLSLGACRREISAEMVWWLWRDIFLTLAAHAEERAASATQLRKPALG